MVGEFWLDDRQWAAIEPLLPKNQPGAHRKDDRRILSGDICALKVGYRWQDCPALCGPTTTIYNRFHRWARRGLWRRLFEALVTVSPGDVPIMTAPPPRRIAPRRAEKGAEAQAIGRSRGGRTTRVHAAVDGCGRPIALEITPGASSAMSASP